MLNSIEITLKSHFWHENVMILCLCNIVMDIIKWAAMP